MYQCRKQSVRVDAPLAITCIPRVRCRTAEVIFAALAFNGASTATATVIGPYAPDADTIALYHFDEAAGVVDPGNPIVNSAGDADLNLTDTGGPDGRDDTGGGGYGATAYIGFGSAFDVLESGDTTFHGGNGSAIAGGLTTAGATTQASLQGADGAFTYEALINIIDTSALQLILSHDGGSRGFQFRVYQGDLSLYTGSTSVTAAIPTEGDHAFEADEWFHVAVAYSGAEGDSDNLTFYWTRLDSNATAANSIGTASLSADLLSSRENLLGVGTLTRDPFRHEPHLVDEVRISGIARGADDFIFDVPEPASLALMGVAGVMLTVYPRKGRG